MRAALQFVVILCLAGSIRGEPAATQPAGAAPVLPASQPMTGIIRGHLSTTAGWDLQKLDLSRAVVYLAADPTLESTAPTGRATMGQRDKTFIPSFMVIPIGTEVEFPNWDHISHNVFSRSKAAPAFDLDRYPFGMSKTRKFDKVGVVQVFCNIHQQMRAVIVVTPNALFARVEADGHFELKGVPQGRHELVIWHERCADQRVAVDVAAGEAPELTVALQENRASIIANDPPVRRGAYGVERGIGVKRERLNLPVVGDAHPAPAQDQPGR